jgi:hypothetical protein
MLEMWSLMLRLERDEPALTTSHVDRVQPATPTNFHPTDGRFTTPTSGHRSANDLRARAFAYALVQCIPQIVARGFGTAL